MTNKSGVSRRKFLLQSGVIGCTAAASPFVTPVTFASAPWDTRLVVIILRGGMDGLDVVQPYGDRDYAGYRPTLLGGEKGMGTDLDGYFSLNNGLKSLMPLWRGGELAFAHAVSTPYRDKRSHFDGQDFLEAGTDGSFTVGGVRDGWLNRLLSRVPGVEAKTAFAVGREDLIILNGDAPVSSWSPDSRLDLSPQGKLLLEAIYQGDPVFRDAGKSAIELADLMDLDVGRNLDDQPEGGSEAMMAEMEKAIMKSGKAGRAQALAKFTADRLNEETRIASFSIGGWDTHRTQSRGLVKSLTELSDALLTLRATLGNNWRKTAVLAMTEFGRTARENGSRGTDHGTGGMMVMAGGAIRGGKVYGKWPGMRERDLYQNRDLMPTEDVRTYAAWAMRGMFGLGQSDLERHIFPGLDMGHDLGILA